MITEVDEILKSINRFWLHTAGIGFCGFVTKSVNGECLGPVTVQIGKNGDVYLQADVVCGFDCGQIIEDLADIWGGYTRTKQNVTRIICPAPLFPTIVAQFLTKTLEFYERRHGKLGIFAVTDILLLMANLLICKS